MLAQFTDAYSALGEYEIYYIDMIFIKVQPTTRLVSKKHMSTIFKAFIYIYIYHI